MQGSADNNIFNLITGYRTTQAIYLGVKLGIFDFLYNGKESVNSLLLNYPIIEDKIIRLVKCLIDIELIGFSGEGLYLTNSGKQLSKHSSNNIQSRALFHGSIGYRSWGALERAIEEDTSGFEVEYGKSFFPYLNENSKELANFNELMGHAEQQFAQEIADAYDFGISEIVDIGGGSGILAEKIANKYPNNRVTVFDLPLVINRIKHKQVNNLFLQEGDFFSNIPSANLYILKRVLHDWDDCDALKIIKNCRDSIKENGKLLVIENYYSEEIEDVSSCWLDINMLALFNSFERKKSDYIKLMGKGKFKFKRLLPISGSLVIMEFSL